MGCIKKNVGIMDIKISSTNLKLRRLNVHDKILLFELLKNTDCIFGRDSGTRDSIKVLDSKESNIGRLFLGNHNSRNNFNHGDEERPLILHDEGLVKKLTYNESKKNVWEVKSIE